MQGRRYIPHLLQGTDGSLLGQTKYTHWLSRFWVSRPVSRGSMLVILANYSGHTAVVICQFLHMSGISTISRRRTFRFSHARFLYTGQGQQLVKWSFNIVNDENFPPTPKSESDRYRFKINKYSLNSVVLVNVSSLNSEHLAIVYLCCKGSEAGGWPRIRYWRHGTNWHDWLTLTECKQFSTTSQGQGLATRHKQQCLNLELWQTVLTRPVI